MRKHAHFLFLVLCLCLSLFSSFDVYAYYKSETRKFTNTFTIQEVNTQLKISWCDYPEDGEWTGGEEPGGGEEAPGGEVEEGGEATSYDLPINTIFYCIFDNNAAFGQYGVDFTIDSTMCGDAYELIRDSNTNDIVGFALVLNDLATCLADLGVTNLPIVSINGSRFSNWISYDIAEVSIDTIYDGSCYEIALDTSHNSTPAIIIEYLKVDNEDFVEGDTLETVYGDSYEIKDILHDEYKMLVNTYYTINNETNQISAELNDVITINSDSISVYYEYVTKKTKVILHSNKHPLTAAWPEYTQPWETSEVYVDTGSTLADVKELFPKANEYQGFKVKGYSLSSNSTSAYDAKYYTDMLDETYKIVGDNISGQSEYQYQLHLYYTWWRPGYVHYDGRFTGSLVNNESVINFRQSLEPRSNYVRNDDPSRLTDGSIQVWAEGDTIYWWSAIGKLIFYEECTPHFSSKRFLRNIDLTNLDVSLCYNLNYLFDGCESLETIDLSGLALQNRHSLDNCFYNCKSLKSIKFPTDYDIMLNSFSRVFYGCESLTELDLSHINIEVERDSFYQAFKGCKNLKNIIYSDGFKPVSDYGNIYNYQIFKDCPANKPKASIWTGKWLNDGSYVIDNTRTFDFKYRKGGVTWDTVDRGLISAEAGKSFKQLNRKFPSPKTTNTSAVFVEWRLVNEIYNDGSYMKVLGDIVDENYVFKDDRSMYEIRCIYKEQTQNTVKFNIQKDDNVAQRYDTVIVNYNKSINTSGKQMPEAPVIDGYTFNGWYRQIYNSDGEVTGTVAFDENVAVSKDIIVIGKYTKNTVTVSFKLQDINNPATYNVFQEVEVPRGSSIKSNDIVLNAIPEVEGYTPTGWYIYI